MTTFVDLDLVSAAIAEAMGQVRADVGLGLGANIEADAVLLAVAYAVIEAVPVIDRDAFLARCDLVDLIPSESFQGAPF